MSCSRRTLSVMFLGAILVASYVIYDYDSKFRVLMMSNSDYRRMTDSLNDRVETLKSELKEIRASNDVILSERDSTIRRMQEDSKRLDRALSDEKKMKETEDAQFDQLSKSHQRQLKELNNLRAQLDSLSEESIKLHHCQAQYDALLRMYHSLSDSYQELQDSSKSRHHQSSQDSSGVLQPAAGSIAGSSSSSSSSAHASQKSNLALPKKSSSTTPKSSSSRVAAAVAPVGVEPPAASDVRSPLRRLNHPQEQESLLESPGRHHGDYFDRADDLNDDFNDDDTDYEGYKKMKPLLEKDRDDVVFHIQQNFQKKHPDMIYDNVHV
eukprot:TRINITY_DN3708_c0_g1_i1.p1 TRINITY_DN3708_c0_g1~~TRINITY_DN3708_c0_g1_i1.p1  ORF type:complete len:324 (-),score=95.11 TRINITY_DN3708_c0_g1_i1:398-1369(-)